MKKVDPTFTTVKKTICPFCSFGCEFGVIFDDFGIRGVEYIKDGSSEGRLCPRGSAAALYLNHPLRLSMPIKNGKILDWTKLGKDLKKVFDKPAKVAVTFDRNLTIEDYHSIISFCKATGVENIASTYFEPEALLREFFGKPFSVDDINKARMVLVVGDPFNQTPMFSKTLIEWKLSNRKNRLVVVDTMKTPTATFASDFLRCRVDTEPLLLLALAQENIEGIDVPGVTGVAASTIADISKGLQRDKDALIFVCLSFAHTYDSMLLVEGLKRLSAYTSKKIIPFVEFPGFEGNQRFGAVLEKIKKKKVKYLVNFGELFPFYYPQFGKTLRGVSIFATAPIKHKDHTVLPIALNLEKQGTILTNRGEQALSGDINPASGARMVNEILDLVKQTKIGDGAVALPEVKVDLAERAKKIVARTKTPKKKKTLRLLGEKIAYSFLGLFEEEKLKINPLDAEASGIKPTDTVSLKSKHGEADFRIRLTTDVDPGIAAIAAETPEVKGLFEYEVADSMVNFVPTNVEIWRKG